MAILGPLIALAALLGSSRVLAPPLIGRLFVEDRFEEFLQAPGESGSENTQGFQAKGKVLPVRGNRIDWRVYYGLPESMRPTKPEEVDVIAKIGKLTKFQIDTYVDPGTRHEAGGAYVWVCGIDLVDPVTRISEVTKSARGSDPPTYLGTGDSNTGDAPDITGFLVSVCGFPTAKKAYDSLNTFDSVTIFLPLILVGLCFYFLISYIRRIMKNAPDAKRLAP